MLIAILISHRVRFPYNVKFGNVVPIYKWCHVSLDMEGGHTLKLI